MLAHIECAGSIMIEKELLELLSLSSVAGYGSAGGGGRGFILLGQSHPWVVW